MEYDEESLTVYTRDKSRESIGPLIPKIVQDNRSVIFLYSTSTRPLGYKRGNTSNEAVALLNTREDFLDL
jgi:hypothetical protein